MSIKTIFEQTIQRGGFDLAEMLERIDLYNVEAKLTDEERESLYALAREHAHPQYNYDAEIEAIWAAIRALQEAVEALESGGSEPGSGETEPADEWPEYVQPTGAHDAYQVGDKITYNGKRYVCKLANCVWSPDAYPAGWEKQSEV